MEALQAGERLLVQTCGFGAPASKIEPGLNELVSCFSRVISYLLNSGKNSRLESYNFNQVNNFRRAHSSVG